ncbi:suppressor of fused domain protein [Paenibacillus lemnae]|uniref:Suppressor of fused domain protein n=1 Tax=Paenibacillus lemnae TaxID=1330551 RepID=A0A848M6G0_PAELE|nr:suppressor of fused domain protein [Paenibacillus lemnae]NMO95839.1 suppressor of fused domain protein [Paenibacillus lemnae]
MKNEEEEQAYGWDAIDQSLSTLYGDFEPKHYGTLIPYELGGHDPLKGISAYAVNEPLPHWHFVTYGFTELYEKESEDPDISGYGFELTFRLMRQSGEEEPPAWALNLLQNMGRYVFNSGNVFRPGDYLDANGPICLQAETELTALAFIQDPALSLRETPNGRMEFIQMLGITADELEAMQVWNTIGVLESAVKYIPCFITDLERESVMHIPEVQEKVQDGMENDGSSTGFLFVDQLGWEPGKKSLFRRTPAILTLGAKQAAAAGKLLTGRIPKHRELTFAGRELTVQFRAGDTSGWSEENGKVTISLDQSAVEEISGKLEPKKGQIILTSIPNLSIHIIETKIKDQDGHVVKVIG